MVVFEELRAYLMYLEHMNWPEWVRARYHFTAALRVTVINQIWSSAHLNPRFVCITSVINYGAT
jgi:hypothetical protein